jgi:hypothetical protein
LPTLLSLLTASAVLEVQVLPASQSSHCLRDDHWLP